MVPAPDTPDVEAVAAWLTRERGGEWAPLARRDHLVLADATRVAKIPFRADGAARVRHGLVEARRVGVERRALPPVEDDALESPWGPVSLWPRLEHRPLRGATITRREAGELGHALGLVSTTPLGGPAVWNPFGRVPLRLAASRYDDGLTGAVADMVERVRAATPDPTTWVYGHGDAGLSNALATATGVWLIDFDSAGLVPVGWDMATMYLHLVLTLGRADAFAGFSTGWRAAAETPGDWPTWLATRAASGTAYLLTLSASEERAAAIRSRIGSLGRWARTGEPLSVLANA